MGVGENDPAKSKESNSSSPKMYLVSLLPVLCIVSAAPEGGLLGFGLLGGGDSTSSTSSTTSSPATTTTALVEVLTSTSTARAATTAESSRTSSTSSLARLQQSLLTSSLVCSVSTIRCPLHSVT